MLEKVPRKFLQENPPAKSSKTYTTKIPDNSLQRGRANNFGATARTRGHSLGRGMFSPPKKLFYELRTLMRASPIQQCILSLLSKTMQLPNRGLPSNGMAKKTKEDFFREGRWSWFQAGVKECRAQSSVFDQRKTKGKQLKGKIVSAPFHTFWHFFTHSHTFSEFFRVFPPGLFLRIKGFTFTAVSVKRDEKRIKENKKIKTKPFCTLVVAHLPSSNLKRMTYRLYGGLYITVKRF